MPDPLFYARLLERNGWDWAFKQGLENIGVQFGKYDGALVGLDAGGLAAIAAGALPVLTQVGVFVALGAGYFQAREIVENEESAWGLAEGFVMGVLGWEWHHVVARFYRARVLQIYHTDEALNSIRVRAYNTGLKAGFLFGSFLPDSLQAAYVKGLRNLAGHPSTGDWSRNVQISFVISLAAAFRRFLQR